MSAELIKDSNNKLDSIFKNIVGDSYILAKILSGTVKEFENMDPEDVMKYLPIEEGRTVRKGNQEFINANSKKIETDTIFELTSPDNSRINLILNIEGQGDSSPGYPIINRMLFYACMMISNQKGIYFNKDDYGNLRSVVCIWVMMNPDRKNRNRLTRYTLDGKHIIPKDDRIEVIEKMELIVVNIGGKDDSPTDVLGMLNTLFADGLDDKERATRLEERYNIPDADYVFGKIRGISMSIDEQLHTAWKREGREEGLAEGRAEGRIEGRIESSLAMAKSLIEGGMTEEETLKHVPEDIRDEVKNKLHPQ